MTPRAVQVLQGADLIAAEDTRHSRKLFERFAIHTPVVAYHEHNEAAQGESLLARLKGGAKIALISDAGTPLVSDPGRRLVAAAHAMGVTVMPIPGACAAVAAFSAAGLNGDGFSFAGFLAAKSSARRKQLEHYRYWPHAVIFYEAPHRIIESLADMRDVFGADRIAVVARELTKRFETLRRAPLGELQQWLEQNTEQQQGEFVVIIEGAELIAAQTPDVEAARILKLLQQELPPKQALKLAAAITGRARNDLYDLSLKL